MKDGFAELLTPEDLWRKLEHDRARMNADPMDSYATFDFFVTAEHLLDWILPNRKSRDDEREDARKTRRDSERLLQITSHIANGAKHFRATAHRHQSVIDVNSRQGAFDPRYFSPGAFKRSHFSMPGLHIELDDGSLRHAFDLADEVLAFWNRELGLKASRG